MQGYNYSYSRLIGTWAPIKGGEGGRGEGGVIYASAVPYCGMRTEELNKGMVLKGQDIDERTRRRKIRPPPPKKNHHKPTKSPLTTSHDG